MYVDDVDATAATRQPPAATKKDATASGADAAACAAAATHPVSLHCDELPPLPLLSFLPSSLLSSLLPLSLCLHRPVTQSCAQHGGDPAAELPLFICQMSSSSCCSASFATDSFSVKRFSLTVAVVTSSISEVKKMRAPKLRNAFRFFFFSHVLPLSDHGFSMAPPSWKQMERKKSSERWKLVKIEMNVFYLIYSM